MRIVRLAAENVKRLVAVEITPNGNMITIGGKNGAGKSSVLDAIAYALGGEKLIPGQPVRKGQDKAKVTVELDDLVVTRTFTAAGGGTLTVSNREGARYPSPQAILDKLVGRLSFDPLAFARMESAKQNDTLRRLAGLDFGDLDRQRLALYTQRTEINRQGKALEHALSALPSFSLVPTHEASLSSITDELAQATEAAAVVTRLQAENDRARDGEQSARRNVERIVERIAQLEQQLVAAKDEHDREQQLATDATALRADLSRRLDQARATVPDLVVIRRRLEETEATNAKVRANTRRNESAEAVRENKQHADQLTNDMAALDQQKADAIAAAAFPVPGLSVTDAGISFNDIPFEQASMAEQLRVSVAVGLALNPQLKVLLVRDGSALDADSLHLMAEMATTAGAQVWVERVTDSRDGVSVLIEDGSVRE